MSQTFDFYDTRAREAEAAAEQANLVMVRERELRSASVWRGLANQDHAEPRRCILSETRMSTQLQLRASFLSQLR